MLKLTPQNIAYTLSKYQYNYDIQKQNTDETIICNLKQCHYPNTNKLVQIAFICPNYQLSKINDYYLSNYIEGFINHTSLTIRQANLYLISSAYDNNLTYQDSTDSALGKLQYQHIKDIDNLTELINILGFYHDFYHDLNNQLNKVNL